MSAEPPPNRPTPFERRAAGGGHRWRQAWRRDSCGLAPRPRPVVDQPAEDLDRRQAESRQDRLAEIVEAPGEPFLEPDVLLLRGHFRLDSAVDVLQRGMVIDVGALEEFRERHPFADAG